MVIHYNYSMESSREYVLGLAAGEKMCLSKTVWSGRKQDYASFCFFQFLEMVQLNYLKIMVGQGK